LLKSTRNSTPVISTPRYPEETIITKNLKNLQNLQLHFQQLESLFLKKKKKKQNRLHYLFPIIMDLGLRTFSAKVFLDSQLSSNQNLIPTTCNLKLPIFDPYDFFLFIHKVHQILFYFLWFVSISTSRPNSKGDLFRPLIS